MKQILIFFARGKDQPLRRDAVEIDRTYRRLRRSVMVGITLGYGFLYTCRLALAVVKKPLIDEGIFSAEQLGMIGSAFFYTYAFGRLTNGFLADHANIKRFFPFGVLVSAVINIAMGCSLLLQQGAVSILAWVSGSSLSSAVVPAGGWLIGWTILWGCNGWFQGFGSPASVVALSHWFSNRERGRFYGIWSTAHSLGEGLTFAGTATLVSALGWQAGFIGPGIFCVIVAVALYFTLQDRPTTLGLPAIADWKNEHANGSPEAAASENIAALQWTILKMPAMWIVGFACLAMSATRYAITSWGILFLQESKGFSLIQAGSLLGVNTIAGIAGCVAYGFVSDKVFNARRPPVTLLYGLMEIGSLTFILFVPTTHTPILTLAFIFYGFSLSGILAALGGLFAIDIVSKKAAGAAMGFIGVFSYLGAAIQERLSGYLIQKEMTISDGVRHYDFHLVALFWLGASVVSLILATSLWRVRAVD